jgi:GDPmannose 4,6-dehydratase
MTSSFSNLRRLGVGDRVQNVSMVLTDFRSVLSVLKNSSPDEIYNLAGQTSVGLSFDQPAETIESIAFGTLNILEAVRIIDKDIRFYSAGSSECFGDTQNEPANELTPFKPRSPYGVAKATSHGLVSSYRESYRLFACSGILFNHESPLRPERFVTQKIIRAASCISKNPITKLQLGNISIYRDWGWAPEYVEAMWLMLQQDNPEDFVIATGKSVSLEYFIEKVFSQYELDWRDHVVIDSSLFRPLDIKYGGADPRKAESILGWKAKYDVDDVISMMTIAAQEIV